jgi:EpsI family protein
MTTKRLAILLVVLLGMCAVFSLPKQLMYQPVGVKLELPEEIGDWHGKDMKITDLEISTLGKETEFARKVYNNGRGDELQVTIVLAGHDMNTSIHRPERCLIAQGWSLTSAPTTPIEVEGRGVLKTTRLKVLKVVSLENGRQVPVSNLNYYWFVGYTDTTASHFERTRIDIRDRLLHGYNQRWAYFTVVATVTQGLKPFGRNEDETDTLIQNFIKKLVPLTHGPTVKFG